MDRRLVAALLALAAPLAPLVAQGVEYVAVDTTHWPLDRTMPPKVRDGFPPIDTSHSVLISRMKADLRVLVMKQHKYYVRHKTYADSVALVPFEPVKGGQARILSAGPGGWSAILTVEGVTCGVYEGQAIAPNAAVFWVGEPGCWFRRRDGVLVGV